MQSLPIEAASSRPSTRAHHLSALETPLALMSFAQVLLGLIRDGRRDLSARQLGVLTSLALQPDLNTIRGLAVHLRVSKPAITRAVDRLEAEGLVKRRPDPQDRRSVCIGMLPAGRSFLDDIEIGLLKPAVAEA
jgi:DNA-binding MarR family transcriptional regulator